MITPPRPTREVVHQRHVRSYPDIRSVTLLSRSFCRDVIAEVEEWVKSLRRRRC